MKDQVLSIEQMKHLYELGVDTSNASMCWVNDPEGNRMIEVHDEFCYEMSFLHPVPAFTLQEIIELLPNVIMKDGDIYKLCFERQGKNWVVYYYRADTTELIYKECETIIESTYELLCWCAENGYLNK